MERLTERNSMGVAVYKQAYSCDRCGEETWRLPDLGNGSPTDKLAEYEGLEEQGLLLRLPCEVGDMVYAYCSEFGILQYEVDNIVIGEKITYQCSAYSEPIGDCPSECLDEIEPDIDDFGKTVFLTHEEAEVALQKMKEDTVC